MHLCWNARHWAASQFWLSLCCCRHVVRANTCLDSWSHICTFCNFYLVVFTAPHLTVLSRTINIFFICIFFALRGWFLFLASKPIAAQSLEIFNREVTLADLFSSLSNLGAFKLGKLMFLTSSLQYEPARVKSEWLVYMFVHVSRFFRHYVQFALILILKWLYVFRNLAHQMAVRHVYILTGKQLAKL